MTEKPSSKSSESQQRAETIARRQRMAAALQPLLELNAYETVMVLRALFDRLRLDEHKNLTRAAGVYEAACTSMEALVCGPCPPDHPDWALSERLAAVGRGARIQTKEQETVNKIRALAGLLDADWSELGPAALVRTLEQQFDTSVNKSAVEQAIKARRLNGRVTWAALAAGVLPDVEEALADRDAWRTSLDAVRDALRTKDVRPAPPADNPEDVALSRYLAQHRPKNVGGGAASVGVVSGSTAKRFKPVHKESKGSNKRPRRT